MYIIGVDPGKTGGAAFLYRGHLMSVLPFKGNIIHCRYYITSYGPEAEKPIIFIEQVTASPQMGVVSAFTFGKWVEAVETAASISNLEYHMIRPQIWQNTIGVFSGGDKKILYNHAKKLFPKEYEKKMFNKETSDAVLIAYYGWRYMENREGRENDSAKL